ncbi:MAG: efflux RND transporter permease subunit, partial [Firmicutes bacterium]|nr:efflux RND transporter permease subunit [Bacillota bacterium]
NVTLDQGMYIEESIGGVMMNLLLGALFAIIILFLFMRSWKITLAIAIAIPFSIIGTFVLMFFMGITLNVVSMSGLALVVGLLVDNSIIVLENIFRLKQKGLPIREAAIKGASQIMNAIIAATITTISVFFPMFFVTGLIMQVFMDLVWVIVFSLASSLLVALMFLPGIISSFKIGEEPKPKTKIGASFSNFFTRIDTSITNALQKPRDFTVKTYNKVLNSAVRFKWATLGIAIVLFIGSAFLLMINGFILMPPTDTGEFGMTISVNNDFTAIAKAEAATGDRARVRAELTRPLEVYIRNELNRVIGADNVNTVVVSMGGGGGMIGMLGGGGSSISVDVVLEDRRNISTAEASEVAYLAMNNFFLYRNMMPTIDEEPKNTHLIRGVSMSASMDMMVDDTVSVTIAAPAARPTEEQVNMLGHAIEFLRYELRDVEGVLRIESDFANRPIRDGAGNIIGFQPQRLQRQDRRVVASLTLSIEQDAVISQVQGRVDSLLNELFGNEENTNEYGVLNGITQVESGFAAQMNDSFVQLALAIIIGFILVYLVLVAMFQSFKTPFVVMVTVPLAFTGGFFLLTVAGLPLSIPAMIGLMILMGVITNNGIVLIDYINKSRDDGMTIREAVIAGANVRARPVLMTAISTIIALIPLAAGMGQGGELMQPLAIISIGGLVYATAMSLLVVPALYSIMFFKKDRQEQKEGVIINHEQVNSSELENEQKKGRGTRVSKGLPTKNAEVKP